MRVRALSRLKPAVAALDNRDMSAFARASALRSAFARDDDPYAGADLANARRLGAVVSSASGLLLAVVAPFAPPTAVLGAVGWLVWAFGVAAMLAGGRLLRRPACSAGFGTLLVVGYAAAAYVLALQWLAGGPGAPYDELLLLWVGLTAGAHPPRRVALFLLSLAAAIVAPTLLADVPTVVTGRSVLHLLLWAALAILIGRLMAGVRAQRVGMSKGVEEARRQAEVDPLTGLGNRRAFDSEVAAALERSRAIETPLSLAVIDVDGFKAINDRCGHLEGDAALRRVADGLTGALRGGDRCFRWGGDEFAVLFPAGDLEQAERICERIALRVAGAAPLPDGTPLTVTAGVAQAGAGDGAAELLARADRELLRRKAAVRERASRAFERVP